MSDEKKEYAPAEWRIDLSEAKNEVEKSGGNLLPEEYDRALMGIAASPWGDPMFALYSLQGLRKALMEIHEMDEEGAEDFAYYNVCGVATRDGGPMFMVEVGD
jgi:hypothetical protein